MENNTEVFNHKALEIRQSIEGKMKAIEQREGKPFSPKQFNSILNGVLDRELKNLRKRFRIKDAIDNVFNRDTKSNA